MKVKKIIAKDMPEALTKIKQELGNDAVILSSKRVEKGGFLGLFKKKNIEVIAAIDPDDYKRKPKQIRKPLPTQTKQESIRKNELAGEIVELKKMIEGLTEKSPTRTVDDYPGELQDVYELLTTQEVKDVYRLQVMKSLLRRWYSENGESQYKEVIWTWAKDELLSMLENVAFEPFSYNKRFLNVVGPTGVGKTTTLAKIAANAALKDNKKVAFITTDTYRIAAIEQLKTYAKILNAPVEVAYSIDDFRRAKEKLNHYDFVLIDSAGRNFRNPLYVEQLSEIIDFDGEMETCLVLALTSKYVDMKKIIDQFKMVKINKFIFTKADETETFGAMVNICKDYEIGASYLTVGQNVPDDIVNISKEKIVERILRR